MYRQNNNHYKIPPDLVTLPHSVQHPASMSDTVQRVWLQGLKTNCIAHLDSPTRGSPRVDVELDSEVERARRPRPPQSYSCLSSDEWNCVFYCSSLAVFSYLFENNLCAKHCCISTLRSTVTFVCWTWKICLQREVIVVRFEWERLSLTVVFLNSCDWDLLA